MNPVNAPEWVETNPGQRAKTVRLAMLLAVLTAALFSPAIRYDYLVYDDGVYVYSNPDIMGGLTPNGAWAAFTSIAGGSWMPLTRFSHMTDVSLFGPSPAGPHAMNIMLHAASAAILLLVLQRMTNRLWPAVFVAALFAVHPLRNESVAWIAERKDVLSTFLWMLGLLAYAHYVKKPGWKRQLLVALCLTLGLLAKPMLVTFPFGLLLLDFWPLKRLGHDWSTFRQLLWLRIREKLPLFLLIALFCATTYLAQTRSGAISENTAPFGERAVKLIGNYAFYVEKSFVPTQLTVIQPVPKLTLIGMVFITVAFLAVTALVIWRAFRQPWLAVGWFWFLGTLVPVIGFVRIGHIAVAERYSYVPSIGLALLVVWSAAEWIRHLPTLRWPVTALGVAAVLACSLLARTDLPRWKDSLTLFESAVAVAPHAVAYNNIAVVHLDRRDYTRAIEPLTHALKMDPHYVKARINRATAFEKNGRVEEAKHDWEQLIEIEPRNAEGYNNRAELLMDLRRLDEAISDFTSAIKLAPNSPNSYNNRANARFMKGDFTAALEDCAKAIALNSRYANAYNTRANVYNRMGDLPRALADYNRAIELAPGDSLTYNNRAAVFLALKRYEQAWADIQRCRQLGGTPHEGLVRAIAEASMPVK